MYLEKRTLATVVVLFVVIAGGIALVTFAPSGQRANDEVIKQNEQSVTPAAPNPNQQ